MKHNKNCDKFSEMSEKTIQTQLNISVHIRIKYYTYFKHKYAAYAHTHKLR
jgi:hypothetical protein